MESEKIKTVPKSWGKEEWIVNTKDYCGKKLHLYKGKRCSLHHHKNKDETFYISEGEVLMEVGDKKWVMKKGDVQRIMPLTNHRFSGLKDSIILEFSTHHEDSDSHRVEETIINDIPKEIMEEYSK